jgi:hypothetical protein
VALGVGALHKKPGTRSATSGLVGVVPVRRRACCPPPHWTDTVTGWFGVVVEVHIAGWVLAFRERGLGLGGPWPLPLPVVVETLNMGSVTLNNSPLVRTEVRQEPKALTVWEFYLQQPTKPCVGCGTRSSSGLLPSSSLDILKP